ncbi:MAG: helix-turn-helix domain-containing protein [Alphaproteobacteria bacterium]|nr:helix-turn-helix domain-containing protein [Alphaproteobacteria bacterium]MCB9690141.1 helix-turn-helix domain-containing protein [Alphaproteobacteria bacterium]
MATGVTVPREDTIAEAQEALRQLRDGDGVLVRSMTLVTRDGEQERHVNVRLPLEASSLLLQVLGHLATGTPVAVLPRHAVLTTQEAADLLNVSRPFLIGLLKAGTLAHHMAGRHRRVRLNDLLEYKRRRDAESRRALDELAVEAQKLGLGY